MSKWLREQFETDKPIIGMAHVPALPGTPRYNAAGGMGHLIEHVRVDVQNLEEGGVDAILYCNEDDRPYVFEAAEEQITALTCVICETKPKTVRFGVDFLWDPLAAMAIAHATGASFIREVLSGTYESDMGLWSPKAGQVARLRSNIGAEDIRIFYNVLPEFASALGQRTVAQRARSTVVSTLADAILISGPMAGEEPNLSLFEEVKAVVGEVPVFMNTGAKHENIANYLKVADGVIVGSSLKTDGYTWNSVDPSRVKSFMNIVQEARAARDLAGT